VKVIPELDDGLYTTTCKYLSPLLERENANAMPYAIDSFDLGAYFCSKLKEGIGQGINVNKKGRKKGYPLFCSKGQFMSFLFASVCSVGERVQCSAARCLLKD